ncbi:hypothetical protein [Sorangium sp. So ce1000]
MPSTGASRKELIRRLSTPFIEVWDGCCRQRPHVPVASSISSISSITA